MVASVGTTYTRINLVGALHHTAPEDTPLLSAIGGLNGAKRVRTKSHTWQTEGNAAVSQPAILEGDDPTYSEVTRAEVSNALQIFQKGVQVTYSTLGTQDQIGDVSTRVWATLGDQPVQNERARQLMLKLLTVKKEIEYSMLRGSYQYPANNSTARKMRGLRSAISTNSLDRFSNLTNGNTCTFANTGDLWTASGGAHGLAVGDEVMFTAVGTGAAGYAVDTPYWVSVVNSATTFELSATKGGATLVGTSDSAGTWTLKKANKLVKADIDRILRTMVEGTSTAAKLSNPVVMAGAYITQTISDIYGYAPTSRTAGGVAIKEIVTEFTPRMGVVFNRWMQPGELYILDLAVLRPVYMQILDHPLFMAEKLAQTGSAENWQLYGELTLEYGAETDHGKIIGLTTA